MDTRQSFVAHPQSAKLMQPGNGSFNDPAGFTQAAAVWRSALGQIAGNPAAFERIPVRLAVVAPITLHTSRFASGPPGLAGNRRDGIDQRQQLRDVIAVGLSQNHTQGYAACLDEDVVLAARFAPIRGVRACFFPPCTARTDELSTTTRDKSSLSAARRRESSTWCSLSHTPASCHWRNRRQQLMPEPQPISRGRLSQGMPVCRTNTMPVSTWRSSRRLRPG